LKYSRRANRVTLAATGTAWTGHGIRTVESKIEEILDGARSNIVIVAYAIGAGGLAFLERVEDCLARGIEVTMILNKLPRQDSKVQTKVRALAKEYTYFTAFSFEPSNDREALHAKVLVVDNSIALVGSANLSMRGLVLNHELGVVITGPIVVRILRLLSQLSTDHRTKRVT
jgi:phosphatidylserine/phosphatidylglycerophosphate/cardiolipin synthase-like enzyme